MSKFTYQVDTMGCKANLTDSQSLEEKLRGLGGVALVSSDDKPDLYVLNTCTVTDQADRDALKTLNKKEGFRLVTGCLAQVDAESIEQQVKNQDQLVVVKNSAKTSFEEIVASWLKEKKPSSQSGDRIGWHKNILDNVGSETYNEIESAKRTRVFYKVQDGCNAFCSYCVIPLARGRSRSLPSAQIVKELSAHLAGGAKEIVLTAIHAADYEDQGTDFLGLVKKILNETNVPRLRLTSLDPAEISDELIALMKEDPRLCAHFHVSLQSASSATLERMKRNYDANKVQERLETISRELPHAYVGMDLIAGFPGETEEEFQNTFNLLRAVPFTKAHVFPYSMRKNTAAARMVANGQAVKSEVISSRARALRKLSEEKFIQSAQAKIGTIQEILVEEKRVKVSGRECSFGHARNYHKVVVPGKFPANDFFRCRIVGVSGEYLKGERI